MADQEKLDQQEKFASGMTDEELVRQVTRWTEDSEDLYSLLQRVWRENLEYYHGNQTDLHKITGKRSRATENRVFMAVETMIPIATSRLPDIEVLSVGDTEKAQMKAQDLQDILWYQMERVRVQEKAEVFLRDMILRRYGVWKVAWDKEADDVDLLAVDPSRIRIPRFGRCVYDLKYVIEELELSYEQLLGYFGNTIAEDVRKSGSSFTQRVGEVLSGKKVRKATYSVREVWTNEYVVWFAGNKVLKQEVNPYFDFKNTDRNFFLKPNKPYIIKSLFHTKESIIGDTDYVQQVLRIQDNINIRKRQIEDITSRVANPMLCIDSDVMSEEEAENITNEPGFILYGKDAANPQKIRFEAPGQVPQYLFQDLEFSRNEFDNIWGVHSTTRGEREGRETLGGRQLLKQADLGRIDLVARQLERALDETAEWFVQLIKLFYTNEHTISILGDDGVRMVSGFSGADVGDVRLIVKPGSTLPRDEVTIHQEAKELWQLGAIGLRTMYKMLRLPNVQDAIQDFADTKSGRILSGGAPSGPIAPGAPPQVSNVPNGGVAPPIPQMGAMV